MSPRWFLKLFVAVSRVTESNGDLRGEEKVLGSVSSPSLRALVIQLWADGASACDMAAVVSAALRSVYVFLCGEVCVCVCVHWLGLTACACCGSGWKRGVDEEMRLATGRVYCAWICPHPHAQLFLLPKGEHKHSLGHHWRTSSLPFANEKVVQRDSQMMT